MWTLHLPPVSRCCRHALAPVPCLPSRRIAVCCLRGGPLSASAQPCRSRAVALLLCLRKYQISSTYPSADDLVMAFTAPYSTQTDKADSRPPCT